MPDYLIEKTLIQQTPIIHFQYGQKGVTLRATEVKPKLDRFLRRKSANDSIPDDWCIGSTDALNYKLRFEAIGTPTVSMAHEYAIEAYREKLNGNHDAERAANRNLRNAINGIYFGNMAKSSDNPSVEEYSARVRESFKETVLYPDGIKLTVICFIPGLKKMIESSLSEFFVVTNFGTMQDKGFGSFMIKGDDPSDGDISRMLREAYGAAKCYSFSRYDRRDTDKTFDRIKTVYSIMKSGINFREYQRSLLFLFMHESFGMGNEKAFVKRNEISPWQNGAPVASSHFQDDFPPEGDPHYFVRALLGVGDHLEFINNPANLRDGKTTVNIKCTNRDIARLASPVFFKVIGGYVYYVGGRINEAIYGAEFSFTSTLGSGTLTVPTKEQLGEDFMDRFMDYCFKKFNDEDDEDIMSFINFYIDEV